MADLDELDQSEDTDDASGTPPVRSEGPDLEALVRSVLGETLKTELDSRFSGMQSMTDKRLAQLAKELKSSNLTQDEQDAILEQETAQEQAKAAQVAELIKRRKSAPEAVEFLLESMEKADLDDQLSFIQGVLTARSKSAPASPNPVDESDEEQEIPDTNKINPPSRRSAALESGEEMNDELADTILDQVGKGQFRRFLGR